MMSAKYRFNAAKSLQAIHFMASEAHGLDLHTALKTIYFSDKSHLNAYQQPIFGATYRAMKYGPVPLEIYEMIKGESLWLSELQMSAMPWKLDGYRIQLTSNESANLDLLAESEQAHFKEGFALSRRMSFNDRTALTHGADWQAANMGEMRYEDMIEAGPDQAAAVAFIRETARHIRL
jgi:hypothetical protein